MPDRERPCEAGVLGNPEGATAEEGQQLLADAIVDLEKTVTDWLIVEPA